MLASRRPVAGLAALALSLAVPVAGAAAPVPAGPTCTPTTLDASALLDGVLTVSPMPGAADASPQTQISFVGAPPSTLRVLAVTGSSSGAHAGSLEPYSQGDGASFVPSHPFVAGERVTVSAALSTATGVEPLGFQFTIAYPDAISTSPESRNRVAASAEQQFHSRPDLHPPVVTVHERTGAQAPADTLLAPYGTDVQSGPMIVDAAGRLLWFEPLAPRQDATNLRVQQLAGAPVLTWWQGTITVHGYGLGEGEIVGTNYRSIATVRAGNGLQADLHEFELTPNGSALITAYDPIHCDLSAVGGPANGAVTDSLLQEIDVRTGLVRFQWTSVDHVALANSYSSPGASSTGTPFDFFHLNSINLDPDESLLVSSRNTWAADDIDPATGQVRWTLGGKASTFAEGPGAATAFQHDARQLGTDTYSLFDNGASPQQHLQSRGVVLTVDPQTNAVTVRQQFLHPGHRLLADSQGNLQALPDGNFFVGWGAEPDFSEFSSTGSLVLDASLPTGYDSYRALAFPWDGRPRTVPALAVVAGPAGAETAYASWNGATDVARWELFEGRTPGSLVRLGSVGRTGFETAIALHAGGGRRYVAVRALGESGSVLAGSATVKLPADA